MRPGWGERHPDVASLLAQSAALGSDRIVFGTTRLVRTAYEGDASLPDDLVLSVRCIVSVGDQLVVCTNVDGASHPWPGGRREPGETIVETGVREVHEETGWLVDPTSFVLLGWMHFEHVTPMVDAQWPWPDFFQVVYSVRAADRDGGDGEDWTDTQGYEATSRLLAYQDAYAEIDGDALARVYLERL